jgi:hypothetical protein
MNFEHRARSLSVQKQMTAQRLFRTNDNALVGPLLRNPVAWTFLALFVSLMGLYLDLR